MTVIALNLAVSLPAALVPIVTALFVIGAPDPPGGGPR
jgi:hypothetical protein